MTEYMTAVFIFSIILGALELLTYKGGKRGGERLAFAILLAFTVLSPVEQLLGSLDKEPSLSIPEYGGEGEAEYEIAAREAIEESIKKQICDSFSVREEYVRVSVVGFAFESMRSDMVRVTLSLGAGKLDPLKVESFVEGLGMGECEVSYEIG